MNVLKGCMIVFVSMWCITSTLLPSAGCGAGAGVRSCTVDSREEALFASFLGESIAWKEMHAIARCSYQHKEAAPPLTRLVAFLRDPGAMCADKRQALDVIGAYAITKKTEVVLNILEQAMLESCKHCTRLDQMERCGFYAGKVLSRVSRNELFPGIVPRDAKATNFNKKALSRLSSVAKNVKCRQDASAALTLLFLAAQNHYRCGGGARKNLSRLRFSKAAGPLTFLMATSYIKELRRSEVANRPPCKGSCTSTLVSKFL